MLKQFVEMRKMLKTMGGAAGGGRKGRQRLMGMLTGADEPAVRVTAGIEVRHDVE